MAPRRRIAILTLSVGYGHVRAAEVIERAVADGDTRVELRCLDAIDLSHSWFDWIYVRPYWWMLRHAPTMWRRLFERRQQKRHRSTAPRWVFRHGCSDVLGELEAFAPDLVVATEIAAAEMAALGKREGCFDAPVLAVLTDFHGEPPWVQREIDFYCVASEEARAQLIGWGVSPNRILFSGIPIDPAFACTYNRQQILQSLGLSERHPVVLVMAGGMGPAPVDRIVQSLEFCKLPVQVIAVTGRDRVMKARVDQLRGKVAVDIRTFGWTDDVPSLMAAADLLITKPGGLTTAEAMAMGVPMVLTHPIPGPEERHVRYLVEQGVAVAAQTLKDVPRMASRILTSSRVRQKMARRAREHARPDAAYAVAQVAHAMIEEASYIDLLSTSSISSAETAYLI
jgi:processive 1,2-diacylglycerol beta-glucosyltransferase